MLIRLVPHHVLFYSEAEGEVEIVGDVFNSFVVGGELDVNPLLFFPNAACDALEMPLKKKVAVLVHVLEMEKACSDPEAQ